MLGKIFTVLTVLYIIKIDINALRVPTNPCPDIFKYYKSKDGSQIYGEITIPYDGAENMNMNLNGSFAALLPRMKFTIKMITTLKELLARSDNIVYEVYFPTQTVLPKMTRIEYNGRVFCSGPPEPIIPGEEGTTNLWASQSFRFKRPPNYVPPELDGTDSGIIPIKGEEPTAAVTIPNRPTLPTAGQPTNPTLSQTPPTRPTFPPTRPTFPEITATISMKPSTPTRDNNQQCGISGNIGLHLIAGGIENADGWYPWLAAIFVYNDMANSYTYKCAANLISPNHVITAGRCVQYLEVQVIPTESILVIMGTKDLSNWQGHETVTRKATKVQVHPEFKKEFMSSNADIALITFAKRVPFSNKIRAVCLWNEEETSLTPYVNKMGTLVGWSSDPTNAINITSMPKSTHLEMPIVPQLDCLTQDGVDGQIVTQKSFCAGDGSGRGSCIGDSGSGLVIPINGVYHLRGISSLQIMKDNKCNVNSYSIFCDVAKFMDWIRSAMFGNEIILRGGL